MDKNPTMETLLLDYISKYMPLLKTRPGLLQRVPQFQMDSYLGITPQSLRRLRGRIMRHAN